MDVTRVKRLFGRAAKLYAALVVLSSIASARDASTAEVTALIGEGRIIDAENMARSATLNCEVPSDSVIETGDESRLELTFVDGSVARFGAKTIAKLEQGAKTITLREGIGLFQVPSSAHRLEVDTERVGLSIAAVTAVFEYHPNIYKLLVLEGTARLHRRHRLADSMLLNAGQMVFGNPRGPLSEPVDFEIQRFVSTSRLVSDFQPLKSEKLLGRASHQQEKQKSKKVLVDTNFVIHGGGTLVSVEGKNGNGNSAGQPATAANPVETTSESKN